MHQRRDTVDLVKKAMEEKRRPYVIVNNRAEGNAPFDASSVETGLTRIEGNPITEDKLRRPYVQRMLNNWKAFEAIVSE